MNPPNAIKYLALDAGAGNIKIWGKGFVEGVVYPSQIYYPEFEEVNHISGDALDPDVFQYIHGDSDYLRSKKFWVAGSGFQVRREEFEWVNPSTNHNLKVKNALPLFLSALIQEKIVTTPKTKIVVVASHHNAKTMSPILKASLIGTHKVEWFGKQYDIEIRMPKQQPVVVEGSVITVEGVDEYAVMDLGFLTSLHTHFLRGSVKSSKTVDALGINQFIHMLCNHDEVIQFLGGVPGEFDEMLRAVNKAELVLTKTKVDDGNGKRKTKTVDTVTKCIYKAPNGSKLDIGESLYKRVFKNWYQLAVKKAIQSINDDDIPVYAVGGGVKVAYIRELLEKNGIQVIPDVDPLFANVESIYNRYVYDHSVSRKPYSEYAGYEITEVEVTA